MIAIWLSGLIRHRSGRILMAAAGVALAVGLFAALGVFLAASRATMTQRAVQSVAVDWQVQVQPGADAAAVQTAITSDPNNAAALPVTFAQVAGFSASAGGSTQTTAAGVVLGLPTGYQSAFPAQIRELSGNPGTMVAQQTASNLHISPGDKINIVGPGRPTTITVDGVVDLPQADSLFQRVGVGPRSQPVAPPDNVLILPAAEFERIMAGRAATTTQIHIHRTAPLAPDPGDAFQSVISAANNLEARTSGGALVGDNLGAALDAARSDAAYAQLLFLFLESPVRSSPPRSPPRWQAPEQPDAGGNRRCCGPEASGTAGCSASPGSKQAWWQSWEPAPGSVSPPSPFEPPSDRPAPPYRRARARQVTPRPAASAC